MASRICEGFFDCFPLRIAALNGRTAPNITAVLLVALQKYLEIEGVHRAIVFSSIDLSNWNISTAETA